MATLKNYVIDEMIDKLAEMEDREVYGADLGYGIFESANIDGTYTYSTQDAIEWIGKYLSEIGDVALDIIDNLGAENLANPFLKPECFMVQIMLEMSNALCGQCSFIDENWNNGFTLTKEVIEEITKELKEMKD